MVIIKKGNVGVYDPTNSIKEVVVLTWDPWLDELHGPLCLSIFKALANIGYRVKVFLPSVSNKMVDEDRFSVRSLNVNRLVPFFTLISLCRRILKVILKERSPVIIFDWGFLPLFLLTKILWGSKGIMLILSRPVSENGQPPGQLHFLHFRLSLIIGKPFVSAFTAISPFEAAEFSRIGRIPRCKMVVVPSQLGEQFKKFDIPANVNELRLKLGLNTLLGKKVLLYHGHLDKSRGVLEVIQLFVDTFKGNEQIALLLVGKGPAYESIKTFIQTNKLNNIILKGPVPYSNIPAIIAACDVGLVILPDSIDWRYQCPTKLLEFLSLGKPVIASDLPGIRWAAGEVSNVIFVKKLDLLTFAQAVEQALTSNSQGVKNAKIQERFSVNQIALKLQHIINEIN